MKRLCALMIALVFVLLMCPVQAQTDVSAQSCILVEELTGYVLYEKNADQRMPMASTTKLFTALMVRECCELNDVVTVSAQASKTEGSSAYLAAGEQLTVEQLLYALLLSSGNDAAEVLAEHAFSGDRKAFIDYMNRRAKDLGLTQTQFTNPSGLPDDNHFTTARELAQIGRMASQDPVIARIASSKMISFTSIDGTSHSYSNHNSLLRMYSHATGLKTGYTKAAGRCLVSSAKKDGISLICVTLNAPNDWNDHINLFDYGFSSVTLMPEISSRDVRITVPVAGGTAPEVEAGNLSSVFLPSIENNNDYHIVCVADPLVFAPIRQGQTVGKMFILYKDQLILRYDLSALTDVAAVPVTEKIFLRNLKRIFNFLLL